MRPPDCSCRLMNSLITGQVMVVGGWTRHHAVWSSLAPHELGGVAQAPSAEISRFGLAAGCSTLEPQTNTWVRLHRLFSQAKLRSPPSEVHYGCQLSTACLDVSTRRDSGHTRNGDVYNSEHTSVTSLISRAYSK